jgi:hypothetical protein
VYQSNYRAGLRILDTENIADAILEEVAYFDVYPSSNSAQFDGTWSNYPYFPSGVIAVSHIQEGLFLLGLSGELSDLGCTDTEACNYDATALEDDGSCVGFNICGGCENEALFCVGCTDIAACNFMLEATIDDSSCFIIESPIPQTIMQEDVGVVFQNGPGTVWYESETASDPITLSDSLEMAFELFPQTVWVANSNGEWDAVGGEEEPDFNNGQYHENNGYWLEFDVFESVVFESVEVYSEQANMHSILILDTDGTVFSEVFQELDEGWNEFILNEELPAGEGYGLRAGNEVPFLWRDAPNADLNYPYEIGSLASIISTSGSNNSQFSYYYYFYNWRMHSADPCISERVEFNVAFDPSNGLESIDPNVNRKLLKIVDYLGREVNEVIGQMVFYIYDDGSAKKVFVVD